MKSVDVDIDRLRRLYLDDGLSVHKIADILNVSSSTVCERMREHGIPVRQRKIIIPDKYLRMFEAGQITAVEIADELDCTYQVVYSRLRENGIKPSGRRIDLPRDLLIKEYVVDGRTADQIAGRLGVNRWLVNNNLKRYGIRRRPSNSKRRITEPGREVLERMYAREVLSVAEIADKLGCTKYTIRRCLKKYKIPMRKSGPVAGYRVSDDVLRRMYADSPNMDGIARKFGIAPTTVRKRLVKMGVSIKGRRLRDAIREDELRRLYEDEKLPVKQIASKFHVDAGTIQAYRKKYGISKRRDYSSPHYVHRRLSKDDAKSKRVEMLAMLGGACAVCGRDQSDVRALQIHHMWYVSGDVVMGNYKSSRRDEYHRDLYEYVKREPQRFRLLCSNCHLVVGHWHTYSDDKRRGLLQMARVMRDMRIMHPTTHDGLVSGQADSGGGGGTEAR